MAGQHSVGYICLFGILGLVVVSTVRVSADLGTGLINGVIYGITVVIAVIPGRPPSTARGIWEQARSTLTATAPEDGCRGHFICKQPCCTWTAMTVPFWSNGWLMAMAKYCIVYSMLNSWMESDAAVSSLGMGYAMRRWWSHSGTMGGWWRWRM